MRRKRPFFELMASMEREHLISLRYSLEYLQDPEGYFRSHEGVPWMGLDKGLDLTHDRYFISFRRKLCWK